MSEIIKRLSLSSKSASKSGGVKSSHELLYTVVISIIGVIANSLISARQTQNRIKEADEQRQSELKLNRVREQLGTFVGPASMHAYHLVKSAFQLLDFAERFYPTETAKYRQQLLQEDKLYTSDEWSASYFRGEWNLMETLVGNEIDEIILKQPHSEMAIIYRNHVKGMIYNDGIPLANLIRQYGGHLREFVSAEEFKLKWPVAKDTIQLRNKFFFDLLSWVDEMKMLIECHWEQGDYSRMRSFNAFPAQISWYMVTMATNLRQLEIDYGIANHEIRTTQEEIVLQNEAEMKAEEAGTRLERKSKL